MTTRQPRLVEKRMLCERCLTRHNTRRQQIECGQELLHRAMRRLVDAHFTARFFTASRALKLKMPMDWEDVADRDAAEICDKLYKELKAERESL